MLTLHDGTRTYKDITPELDSSFLPPEVKWIDILDGTPEEVAFVERALKRHLPTKEELNEIESSSRLRADRNTFYLSATVVSRGTGIPKATPVGFILTKDLCVTIRYAPLLAFTSFEDEFADEENDYTGSAGAFVGLIAAIVDRAADLLENVESELDQISQHIFYSGSGALALIKKPARATASLRETLKRIGHNGDLSSKIRDSLLGMGRIVSYVGEMGADWFSKELKVHLKTQHHDITSLSDYDMHLMNKVQLLLDATMGMINIEQNNIIKVLTVVSVVGIPPTLVASMYGMNFKYMPELDWAWGYPWGLLLILLSGVAPIVWFKIRGWL